MTVPQQFGDRLVGGWASAGLACVAVRRCRLEDGNKLAPLCCRRWGFRQTTPVWVCGCRACWKLGGALFTGALAALLGVGLDISLESSHVGRSERVADWKG